MQLRFHKELGAWGTAVLVVFDGHPKLELIVVMVILPFFFNTLVLWVQDSFLKGDKHLDARRIE